MRFFGSKKIAAPVVEEKKSAMHPGTVIYTMPEKFFIPEAAPFWTATKIWTIIAVVLVALIGLVYWLVIGLKASLPEADTTSTAPVNTETILSPETLPTEVVVNEPVTPEPVPVTPTPTPPVTPTILPRSTDTDGDDLTDAEETVYGTDNAKADTDGDGFLDLSEILRGYNPKGSGVLPADFLKTYTSTAHQYAVRYPSSWAASEGGGADTTITASADELFVINVEENLDKKSVLEWYQQTNPTVDTTGLAVEVVGERGGIFLPDRRTFLFVDPARPDRVFILSYLVGTKTETNFSTTFEMLIRQLDVSL